VFDVCVAAPEDGILGKLWYFAEGGGDRHLRDIAGILRVTGDGVSRAEVERWAIKLGYLDNLMTRRASSDGCVHLELTRNARRNEAEPQPSWPARIEVYGEP
jgi:hypothetical protein